MKNKVYAQVYSLIRVSREGALDAIRTISEIGYDGIEAIGAHTGGLELAEFKSFIRDMKLDIISFHGLDGEKDLEFAQSMGARFTDARVSSSLRTRDEALRAAEELNLCGEQTKKFGLKSVLHNHATEFFRVTGEEDVRIYDLLIENTDPELVGFELDVGWAALAGVKCEDYITKYAGRFDLLHVKECDRAADSEEDFDHFPKSIMGNITRDENGAPVMTAETAELMYGSRSWNCALGEGLINWQAVRDAAEKQGVQGYVNEREYYHIGDADGDPVRCAKLDYDFLRAL